MQLDLGERARLADDVDVALHELAVAALLRALGPPDRRDLDRAEHGGQLGAVGRVEAGQRHGEVEAQPEVGQVERVVGRVRGRSARRGRA